ncbi:hypothetical protein RJ639_031321 [Escallonia herrerae]|uniref:Pentatricopeptide repeat-containing protein n=1 Tax=Escallonia herrerae TaxID=1293975 RepID=A0AA88WYX6_9ASTE|nr:hypothetical protein RJ639_031321 [Escallonia herrerae]
MFISFYSTYPNRPPSRSLRRRISKRKRAAAKPVLDEAQFQRSVSQVLPRFTPEELCNVITMQDDPLMCLELFNWASQQPRFRHDVSTYHITIKKLGAAQMYEEMDVIVNQVFAIRFIGSEALYNTMIYFFTEARKLTRAVNMDSVYNCQPNSFSYDYLIHGLCAQGRTNNAREFCKKMKKEGFIPSCKSYNSLVNSFALGGEVEEAVKFLWEMIENRRSVDFITYRTVLEEVCRQWKADDAMNLLKELQENDIVDGFTYRKLLHELEDDYRN